MKAKSNLTAEMVRSLFEYDPLTGIFLRKISPHHSCPIGSAAGCKNSEGYIKIMVEYSTYAAHRLAWLYVTGEWPEKLIDHIDGNPANNAFSNLREATRAQNAHNANRAGYSFNKSRPHPKKYQATIFVDQKLKHLGFFLTADEAKAAYLAATKKYFGEFSVENRRTGAAA